MSEPAHLSNQFLIAMPGLADPNFHHTVTYLCQHSDEGAMGIVINRPLDITLSEVFEHMEIKADAPEVLDTPVHFGGPVQRERGFVIHRPLGAWESTLAVSENVGITTSRDILEAIAHGSGPERSLIALGYAGWGAGQLEQELADNAWLSGPCDPAIIFDTPAERRWQAAATLLGVDLSLLSGDVGHA